MHKEFPRLRIGLGHFAHDALKFTKAMENGAGSSMWALTSLADVLRSGDGVIYADLGYTEELIDPDAASEDLPCRFFEQLKRYCQGGDGWQAVDPTMTQIMLGSDWIMLGQEERHAEYLSVIDKALTAARWEDWERANLLHTNAPRFLSMPV